jgi:hypothetical protein
MGSVDLILRLAFSTIAEAKIDQNCIGSSNCIMLVATFGLSAARHSHRWVP